MVDGLSIYGDIRGTQGWCPVLNGITPFGGRWLVILGEFSMRTVWKIPVNGWVCPVCWDGRSRTDDGS